MSRQFIFLSGLLLFILLAGCSSKDPPTVTPSYHSGPQTGSSASINSWEVGQNAPPAPKHYQFPAEASQRGFEPYDALAEKVYIALQADNFVPLKYVTISAKGSDIHISGTVETQAQTVRAIQIARGVAGVRAVQSHLQVRAL